ncbi:MAG: hypothetical protein ABH950_02825 [Candidatus Altiarchaeota archaeon]
MGKSKLPLVAEGLLAFLAVGYGSYMFLDKSILTSIALALGAGVLAFLLGLSGGSTGGGYTPPRHDEHQEEEYGGHEDFTEHESEFPEHHEFEHGHEEH